MGEEERREEAVEEPELWMPAPAAEGCCPAAVGRTGDDARV